MNRKQHVLQKLKDHTLDRYTRESLQIKYIPRITEHGISDYIALVKWVGFTDEKIITIPIDKIITIANATPEFTKRYGKLVVALRQAKQALPSFLERDIKDDEWDDEESDPNIDKDDIKELSDLLNMPSKKIHQCGS